MNRKTGTGIVVGAIALGILLGQFWKIPGLGVNDPETSTTETQTDETKPPQPAPLDATNVSVNPGNNGAGGAVAPIAEEAVIVVIHGSGYRLTRDMNPETGIDIGLKPLVAKALATTGDSSGIRVRILLHSSAQEGARFDLFKALNEAGLKSEQIQEVEDPVL